MRADQAPRAGWYPDPEGGSRLRWWEGTDWTDRYRSRPVERGFLMDDSDRAAAQRASAKERADPRTVAEQAAAAVGASVQSDSAQQQMQAQLQQSTEWARAQLNDQARQFQARAERAVEQYSPIAAQQVMSFAKFVKRAIIALLVLLAISFVIRIATSAAIAELIDQIREQGASAVAAAPSPIGQVA